MPHESEPGFGEDSTPLSGAYPLYAATSTSGFFGLSQLQAFCRFQLEPLVRLGETDSIFVLDFSRVAVWDVSAVLWLVVALQHYRRSGLSFRLRLPDSSSENGAPDCFSDSADYLRRWHLDRALAHIGDLATVLVPEQLEYFSKGPRAKYVDSATMLNRQGRLERVITGRLVEIRDLSRVDSKTRQREVSNQEINTCIREFEDAGISNVLYNNCAIGKDNADSFAVHLVGEALLNMQQHPNATTGLLAVSVMGNTKELILAVVDNGDSIPNTILDVFNKKHGRELTLDAASHEEKTSIVDYATQRGVSRKRPHAGEEVGLGLTYIKQDTIDRFGGKLRIITESTQAIFKTHSNDRPESSEWQHSWPGNLLRVSVPLK